ncbi:MAG: hypothetical protein AAF141_02860 [Pseudomonadota bacterium]
MIDGETRKRAWLVYLQEALATDEQPEFFPVAPELALKLLFAEIHPFSRLSNDVKSVPYDRHFDDDADLAIATIAMNDDFSSISSSSLQVQRVVYERYVYALTVIAANWHEGTASIAHLPEGLSDHQRVVAILLLFLLNGAREIDRRLLPSPSDGSPPALPSGWPTTRQ